MTLLIAGIFILVLISVFSGGARRRHDRMTNKKLPWYQRMP